MMLGPEDFLGRWRISRQITDFRIMETGTLDGEVTFSENSDGISYHEKGTLRFAGGSPVLAERQYIWVFAPDVVHVLHADGAPFHSFTPTGGPEATPHLCGEDMYRGHYSFVRFPSWQVIWNVEGPRKKYRSETRYERD